MKSRREFLKIGLGTAGAVVGGRAVAQMCSPRLTAPQGLGPFFPDPGDPELDIREIKDPNVPIYFANDNDLTYVKGLDGHAQGQQVHIMGRLQNEKCEPISDAIIIAWQASKFGKYNHKLDTGNEVVTNPENGEVIERKLDPNFQYWGTHKTNEKGQFWFKTIVPGPYPAGGDWWRPPHIHFRILDVREEHESLVTQTYFQGEAIEGNDWIQRLNDKDLLLRDPNIKPEDQEHLIINFEKSRTDLFSPGVEKEMVLGEFDITLQKKS